MPLTQPMSGKTVAIASASGTAWDAAAAAGSRAHPPRIARSRRIGTTRGTVRVRNPGAPRSADRGEKRRHDDEPARDEHERTTPPTGPGDDAGLGPEPRPEHPQQHGQDPRARADQGVARPGQPGGKCHRQSEDRTRGRTPAQTPQAARPDPPAPRDQAQYERADREPAQQVARHGHREAIGQPLHGGGPKAGEDGGTDEGHEGTADPRRPGRTQRRCTLAGLDTRVRQCQQWTSRHNAPDQDQQAPPRSASRHAAGPHRARQPPPRTTAAGRSPRCARRRRSRPPAVPCPARDRRTSAPAAHPGSPPAAPPAPRRRSGTSPQSPTGSAGCVAWPDHQGGPRRWAG